MKAATAAAARVDSVPPLPVHPGEAPVEVFLRLLARAVRNFKLYPVDSSYRVEAITACHEAHTALRGSERLVCRVTPCELLVDDEAIGSGTIIEQELARRLHLMQVAELTIESTATSRDLAQLCAALVACEQRQGDGTALAEQLRERGVDAIVPRVASRPEVLEVDTPAVDWAELARRAHEETPADEEPQASRGSADGVGYLYPKGKGWVRLNPGATIDAVSITDLASAVDDPRDLSLMLLRLSCDGGHEGIERNAALRLKFDDLTLIFSAMGPERGRQMFGKLARAVLALGEEARRALLKESVLPGLVEGRSGGQILNDFPDVDLADAIGMLLELETADPGVINSALSKLELPPERRQSMKPLLQRRFKDKTDGRTGSANADDVLDRFAEKWIKVDSSVAKSLVDLSAFDLAFDADARAQTDHIDGTIETADPVDARLTCLLNLIAIGLNPQLTDGFLDRLVGVLGTYERDDRWDDLIATVSRIRELGGALQATRADVSEALVQGLTRFWTRTRTLRVIQMETRGGDLQSAARRLVEAFGVAIAPSFVALIEDKIDDTRMVALLQLMRTHARALAPGLASALKSCSTRTACVLLDLLAAAGPGSERAIAARMKDEDDAVYEAALAALARIGSSHAATAVASAIRTEPKPRALLAEKFLVRLPREAARAPLFDLLRDREFVMGHPDVAVRLLERARSATLEVPRETLARLSRLMYRVWRPAHMRLGFKARGMLGL